MRIMAVGFDACGSWQHDQILTIDESVPFSVTHLSIVYGTVSARFFLQPAVACRFTDHAAAASALRYGIVSIENVPALCRSSKTVGTGTTARGRCGQITGRPGLWPGSGGEGQVIKLRAPGACWADRAGRACAVA